MEGGGKRGEAGAEPRLPITALSQPGYSNVLLPKPLGREDQLDLAILNLPASMSRSRDEDCYIVETRIKVGPQKHHQQKPKSSSWRYPRVSRQSIRLKDKNLASDFST